ncbi:DNA-3-methyladenine glycosylase I [Dokdonella sp.]|uniref:DNA-3-methyladenine glycosylase I n=1 Tax=Dokdonella sp. TaxID=2291710 RepID=UPI001B1466F2|nr:DNA-3-methyladenine glycosylase I [Dokdonella sp.]MBO9661559.1 DNA-3-methyladenine glycosylase I [Dokdonella sp.]
MQDKTRCAWASRENATMQAYHDGEWGAPLREDRALFEFLCLEGAQAGLSWRTVLEKRDNYRRAFADFDIDRCARLTDARIEKLLTDPGLIRNRLKITSVRGNARAALAAIEEFGSLGGYLWSFVDGAPLQNVWRDVREVPATTAVSDRMSKELRKRGFRFVGSTICYAFMQATGMVNDHLVDCFRHRECARLAER